MNILLISQYFPPDLGGAATRNGNLAKGLSLNGCSLTIITAFPHYPQGKIPKKYKFLPFKVEWNGKTKLIRTFVPPIKSEGLLKRLILMASFAVSSLFVLPLIGKTDAIWGGSWAPGLFYSKIKQSPVVLDVCDLTLEDLPMLTNVTEESLLLKIASTIYRFFYVKGDAVAPISPRYVSTIVNKYAVNRDRASVIPVGVDLSEFKKEDNRAEEASFKIIYAGVLGIGYDFEQVFSAAKILEHNGVVVEFILHGTGECLPSLKKRLQQLNLTNVTLSDKLYPSRREVGDFLNQADAFILPLKDYGAPYPGIPSKLYEYQAIGKPIICCAEGEPATYISATNSGIVVKPQNPQEIAKAVAYLSANRDIARQMGENGRLFVEREVDVTAIGAKAKALFLELIAKNL